MILISVNYNMDIDHQKLRYISGPVSVISLEGKINNTKKTL